MARKPDKTLFWTRVRKLGDGGNAEVWLATCDDGTTCAVKFLTKKGGTAYERFKAEIRIMQENRDVAGIMPIHAVSLPENPKPSDPAWYSMPVAIPLATALKRESAGKITQAVAEIATNLVTLHVRGICHRDIKPQNLYVLNDEPHVGDFGLADDDSKPDHTESGERIGARWTLAPEMERSPKTADGKLADVYSLAKSLWILLTGNVTGFEGQYNAHDPTLSLTRLLEEPSLTLLENLITISTSHNPATRPSMKQFRDGLLEYVRADSSFHRQSIGTWHKLQERIFPTGIPRSSIWTDLDDIVRVLNTVGLSASLNHMFFPDGGGLDLHGASRASEDGCIALNAQGIYILRPKELHFESFGPEYREWSYFRLEAGSLLPTGVENALWRDGLREELLEFSPGRYVEPSIWEEGCTYDDDGDSVPLPKSARPVTRYLRGSFVIFAKASWFNHLSKYDGKHSRVSPKEFRDQIERFLSQHGDRLRTLRHPMADDDEDSIDDTLGFLKST